jgi:hypothetical protein
MLRGMALRRPMKRKAVLVASAACGCLVALTAAAQELPEAERFVVRAEYRQWNSRLEGSEIQVGSDGVEGTAFDPVRDLGVGEYFGWQVKGAIKFGGAQKLRGSYSNLDYDGEATLDQRIRFQDTTFQVGSQLVTSIKGGFYNAAFEWDVVRRKSGILGLTFGAHYLDVDMVLVARGEGMREIKTIQVPLPAIGIVGRYYVGRFLSLEGEASGLTIGDAGSSYDLEAAVRLHMGSKVAIGGGYRKVRVRSEEDVEHILARVSGWFVAGELSL